MSFSTFCKKTGTFCVLMVVCIVAGFVSITHAQTSLPDTSFQDWTGTLDEVSLADGSILAEYTARTYSGRVEGAMLAVSFFPRFECTPMISLRTAERGDLADIRPVLEITLDDVRQNYSAYVDRGGDGFVVYSLAVAVEELERFRRMMDVSPRIGIRVLGTDAISSGDTQAPDAVASADGQNDEIVFSLLGSKRSADAVENHCREHKSVAWQASDAEVEGE